MTARWAARLLLALVIAAYALFGLLAPQRDGCSDQTACLVAGCAFGIFTVLSISFTTGLVTGGLATVPLTSALFIRRRTRTSAAAAGSGLRSSSDSTP